jgi:signal transduction histidine kinase
VKLAQRVLLYTLTIIVVLLIAMLAIVDNTLHKSISSENASSLEREARFVAVEWMKGADPDSLADAAGRALKRRVTLVDSVGVVIGDSEFDGPALHALANHLYRPEIVAASQAGVGMATRQSASRGDEELYVAVKAGSGFARVSVGTGVIETIFDRARRAILITGIFALAGAILVAWLFARKVSRPITELRDVAHAMADRDFSKRDTVDAPGEVGDLASTLTLLSTRLEQLESVRRDFVANVSHELKTPLTVVGGFAETIADRDLPAEQREEFAGMILTNTRRMQRIVDDLLDLSRIESGGWIPMPEQVDVTEIVREVIAAVNPASLKDKVSIRSYVPAAAQYCQADRTAIRQILSNLLENALRHTSEGFVTVFAEAADDGVWIGLRDSGEGISEEHLSRIFERFYRVDTSRAREHGGTGLGLSIVKHLAEAHGGRVRATSRRGEGTSIAAFFPNRHQAVTQQPHSSIVT